MKYPSNAILQTTKTIGHVNNIPTMQFFSGISSITLLHAIIDWVSENSEKCIVEYSLTCPIGNYTILEILAGDGKYTGTWTLILPFYPNQGILPSSAWGLPWVISIKFLLPTLICVKKSSPQFTTSFRGYENKTRQVLVGILYQWKFE